MEFIVLGRVEMIHQGRSISLSKSKVGQMLSLLLARVNETVSTDVLIDELWTGDVPQSVQTTLQTYVYHARKLITQELGHPHAHRVLVTRPPGYAIETAERDVDANVFELLVKEGTARLKEGDAEATAARLSEALALRRGPAFSGMRIGPMLEVHATYLNELRLTAVELRIEAFRQLGYHRELVPELRSLVAENPLNERFHGLLIQALHECGRRAEALQAYQRLWQVLDRELGVRPTLEIQKLHGSVLA